MGRLQPRRKKIFQDSPFLDLPGEIRNLIYRACLTRPEPLDLCSGEFLEYPTPAPLALHPEVSPQSVQAFRRVLKARESDPGALPLFRKQTDLLYVRKEMAIGLLATCRQVCAEARHVFWGGNSWRFGCDREWRVFRRWVASIGGAVELVREVEVCVPMERVWFAWGEGWNNDAEAKNEPKLHMSKVPKKGVRISENVEGVAQRLKAWGGKLKVRFVVPPGVDLNYEDPELPWLCLPEGVWGCMEMTLVVRKGATIWGEGKPASMAEEWEMGVVLEEGCLWRRSLSLSEEDATLMERREWANPAHEKSSLIGVRELLDEEWVAMERVSVAASGGKANKLPGRKSTARVLKGFGGCRFVRREFEQCSGCGFRQPEPNKGAAFLSLCNGCNGWFVSERVVGVVLRKQSRAARLSALESK